MAINFYNTAEGGTDGTTVTTGSTGGGSGTAMTLTTAGTGSLTFSTDVAHNGSLSYKLTPGSGSNCSVGWGVSGSRLVATRCYVYMTGYPSTPTQFVQLGNGSIVGLLGVANTGNLFTQDINGTISASIGTSSIPLNTWLRVELAADVGPTGSGDTSIWVAVYLGDDTTSPIYAYSTLAASSTTANMGTVRMGKVSNSGTWGTMYIDDLVVQSDVTTIGPANTASSNWFYV